MKKHIPNSKENGKRHITNESQHPELKMKENEVWKRDFVGKHAKLKPCWEGNSGVKMCTCWHINGDCFKDCKNSTSHVRSCDIPSKKLAAMKNS